ncbi:MAG: hypothetical protein C0406_09360 [Sideroxydans sp.]|nr:hypothetical protein [Sideroxydans sp.]
MAKAEVKKVKALKVVSLADGFRRGGRAWVKGETIVALTEFSKEQIAAIKAESNLTVAEVEIEVEAAAE